MSICRNEENRYELEGIDDELIVNISVINRGEDAHEATVTVTLPPYLAFRGSDRQVRCNSS